MMSFDRGDLSPQVYLRAVQLRPEFATYFRDVLEGRTALVGWSRWWDQHAVELERDLGPALFLRLKLDPLQTLSRIMEERGTTCRPPPEYLPIEAEEYNVASQLIDYFSRNEGPDSTTFIRNTTATLPFDRWAIEQLMKFGAALDQGLIDQLYLRNFRSCRWSNSFSCARRVVLVEGTEAAGAGHVSEISRIAFERYRRIALAAMRVHSTSSQYDWIYELRASDHTDSGGTTWKVVEQVNIGAMEWD